MKVLRGLSLSIALAACLQTAQAKYIGADAPNRGIPCPEGKIGLQGEAAPSLSEGNLREDYPVCAAQSAFGTTLSLGLTYNSYNADGSRAAVDTVMGYGWTHTYNVFLFAQRSHMFLFGPDGRVTKFILGAGNVFTADAGSFDKLVKNPDGSYTITASERTEYLYQSIPSTPFLVGGSPVWRLARIKDRNNNITTFQYTSGKLTQVTDAFGRTIQYQYNAQNKVSKTTDPLGRATIYTYDTTGRKLTRITDPAGRMINYSYNAYYQLTSKVDKDGRTFSYAYSDLKPTSTRDGANSSNHQLSNSSQWGTDATALSVNMTRVYTPSTTTNVDGHGRIWRYSYDAQGYVTKTVAPDGATTQYEYDPSVRKLKTRTDANGHVTQYEYDSRGNQTKRTDHLGNATTYAYEPTFNRVTSVTDPNGRVTAYQYDANGNCVRTTEAVGLPEERSSYSTYNSQGNLLTHIDPRGHQTTYTYDPRGNVATVTEAVGEPIQRTTQYTYDIAGRLISTKDALGHSTTYAYDAMDRPISRADALGHTTSNSYDNRGNLVTSTDANGRVTAYTYDSRSRRVKTTDAAGKSETYTYDGNNNQTSSKDRRGNTTTFIYDDQNRRTSSVDPLGNTTQYQYDPVGNLTRETDPRGLSTHYSYDALNRRVTRATADGGVTTYEYATAPVPCCSATLGQPLVKKETDANGRVTYYHYDALDRRVEVIQKQTDTAETIDGDDAVTRTSYDANNNVLTTANPNGNVTSYEYDALNRRTQSANPAGEITRYTYDPVDNLTQTESPNGNITTSVYDAAHRRVATVDLNGPLSASTYDNKGNVLTVADGAGNQTTYVYDALDRRTQIVDPIGNTTAHAYDPNGNLVSTIDREGIETEAAYDAANRMTARTEAAGTPVERATQYVYDAAGNVTATTDPVGRTTTYSYDTRNRLAAETYPQPPPNTRTYSYDAVGNLISRTDANGVTTSYEYTDLYFLSKRDYPGPGRPDDRFIYDLGGRLTSVERDGWVATFVYDAADRLIQSDQQGRVINYAYDVSGRERTMTHPSGYAITTTYDFRSRIVAIADPMPLATYTYDAADRAVTKDYRNGVTTTYSYDANARTTSVAHGAVTTLNYGYDNEGNRLCEENLHDANRSEACFYDPLARLVRYKAGPLVACDVPAPGTETVYNLDLVSNWASKTTDSVTQTRLHNTVNEVAQIDSTPLLYDANGNLIQDGRFIFSYDEENRLETVTRISDSRLVAQYQYDALGRRNRKVADADPLGAPIETTYFYDGARAVEEQDGAGATLATYVYGLYIDGPLAMHRLGATFFYHENGNNNVVALTDNVGAAVERYAYGPYGAVLVLDGADIPVTPNSWGSSRSPAGNPWLFTGRQYDEETGLYYYRARTYDFAMGRFLQRDPLGYVDGMNLYEYVRSNPASLVDPFGNETVKENRTPRQEAEALFSKMRQIRESIAQKLAEARLKSDVEVMMCLNNALNQMDTIVSDVRRYLPSLKGQAANDENVIRLIRLNFDRSLQVDQQSKRCLGGESDCTGGQKTSYTPAINEDADSAPGAPMGPMPSFIPEGDSSFQPVAFRNRGGFRPFRPFRPSQPSRPSVPAPAPPAPRPAQPSSPALVQRPGAFSEAAPAGTEGPGGYDPQMLGD